MVSLLRWLGAWLCRSYAGQLTTLGFATLGCVVRPAENRRHTLDQLIAHIYHTGVQAVPLVAFLALALGTLTVTQSMTVMPKLGAGDYIGNVMVAVVIRELGPLFTAFLVAGRTGAALSTYLANMKVHQEVDALRTMGIDPIRFLVFPFTVGTVVSMFGLTILFNFVALFGGFMLVRGIDLLTPGIGTLHLSFPLYLDRILASLGVIDGVLGLAKPVLFGLIVALISCHQGLSVHNDIRDVPRVTTQAVVSAFVSIILLDFLMALPFFPRLDIVL